MDKTLGASRCTTPSLFFSLIRSRDLQWPLKSAMQRGSRSLLQSYPKGITAFIFTRQEIYEVKDVWAPANTFMLANRVTMAPSLVPRDRGTQEIWAMWNSMDRNRRCTVICFTEFSRRICWGERSLCTKTKMIWDKATFRTRRPRGIRGNG